MAYLDNSYKSASYAAPSDDIHPDKKDKDWRLRWCKYIYSYWANNNCLIRNDDELWIMENRSYMHGRQDVSKYQNWLLGSESKTNTDGSTNTHGDIANREGWANISWRIFSIMPKYLREFKSIMTSTQHETKVDAIDKFSSDQKMEAKAKMWIEKLKKPVFDQVRLQVGLAVEPEEDLSLPRNLSELNLYEKLGRFKLQYEKGMKSILDYTFSKDFSMWVKTEDKCIEDIFACNMAFVSTTVNKRTMQVEPVYCQPENVIVEWSRKNDFKNSRFFGTIDYMTIRDFRSECGLSEEEAKKLAQKYATKFGNRIFDNEWETNPWIDTQKTSYKFDNFTIPYCQLYWKSLNSEKKEGEDGKPFGMHTVFQAKWVIGTDYIWDDGYMTDQIRPTEDISDLPFAGIKIEGIPIAQSCIPMADAIQMAFINMQLERSSFVPSGYEYDLTQLENIVFGGEKMNTRDIISFHRQTGNILKRSVPLNVNPMGAGSAAKLMEGGTTSSFEKLKMDIDFQVQKINEITGIYSLTTQGKSDIGLGITQMLVASTNNIIKPLYDNLIILKESVARQIAFRAQVICMFNKDSKKGYASVISQEGVEAIKVAALKHPIYYGISIYEAATQQEKAKLKADLASAMMPGRNGRPIISPAEYIWISGLIDSSVNYKDVAAILHIKEQEGKDYDMQMAKAGIQEQGQQQAMLEMVSYLNDLEKQKNESENKEKQIITAGQMDILKEQAKSGDAKAMQNAEKKEMTAEQKLLQRINEARQSMNPQPQPQQGNMPMDAPQ